jgi:putative lipoic acid-binding regulatory protein
MANEPTNIENLLQMLNQSAPVTEAPPGTFDLGTIEPFNPIMERYQPNPLDEFAMMMADPTKKLKVISTPVKMQLKPMFAKRNKLKELIKKQEQNYKRGQDLASKYDPKDSAQGNYMMNAAINSGKRFQRQLNELEEKIRKIYQSK